MADTQFVDDYVELLRAKGNENIFAWRTPDGEIYYGDQPRVQETGIERVSQVEDVTTPDVPDAVAPSVAPTGVSTGGAGGDGSDMRSRDRINISDMDAAELSEASKAALMTFSGISAIGDNPVMEALAAATGVTGAALGKLIADNNMATLNAINLRAQELGINLDTEGNIMGMSPEQIEEIKTRTAFERGGAPDFTTTGGRQAASRRASQRDITGEALGMEKEGLFGMEWSREQQDRIRNEFLGESAGTDGTVSAPTPARPKTPVRRPSSGGVGRSLTASQQRSVKAANVAAARTREKYGAGTGRHTAPSGASGGGGGGDDKIVCTAMNDAYGFGGFRNLIWLKYAKDNLTKAHEIGYHVMFRPLIKFSYVEEPKLPQRIIRTTLEHIARHRSVDIRAEMGNKKRDAIGRTERAILEPLCYIVGLLMGKGK